LIFVSTMQRLLSKFLGLFYMIYQTCFVKIPWPNYEPFETCSKYYLQVVVSVKNWYLHLQCTDYSQIFQDYSSWPHKHVSWRFHNPITNHLKHVQNIIYNLLFQWKFDISIYNALITLKLFKITVHDLTNIFRVGSGTQLWTIWKMFKIFFESHFFG
jgi:hypothetical protein